ncbi:MAG: hypothetical protein HQK81_14615 [Desulfovibrionaceae bacterium]|nr:hypothetical protein [Desulfovibrionaceae bacterium]
MSISAICGGYPAAGVAPVQGGVQIQAPPAPATFASTPDQADFSRTGSALSQLMQLQKSDPQRFKELAGTISGDLQASSSASGDPKQAQIFTEMSQKFAQAAQTGAMPDLSSPTFRSQGGAGGLAQALGNGGQALAGLATGAGKILAGHAAAALTGGLSAAVL